MYRSPRGSFGKEADAVSAVTAYAAQAAHFILPVIALIVLIRCVASMFYGRAEPETWGHLVTPDGKVYPLLHWECLIGRARSADITLPYPDVANVHAVLMRNDAGEWTVSDLSRSGGVYLNGEQITEPTQVFSGDILRCSTHMLKFADMSEERRAVQEQRRTIAGRKVSAGGTLFFLTVFQLLLALEFVSSADSAHLLGILMSFAALALTQWFCYVLMRTMDRSGFEVETIAFFLCTLGLEICATSTPDDLTKEIILIIVGIALFFLLGWWLRDLSHVKALRWPAAIISLALLALNLFAAREVFGAKNWLTIAGFSLQPSELIKVAFIYVGATSINRMFRSKSILLFIAFSAICVGGLALMGDFGSALIFFATFLVIAFMRSGSIATVLLAVASAAMAGTLVLSIKPHVAQRFATWGHVWEDVSGAGFQQTRALSAAASGGLFGQGAGCGWLKNIFAANTDMVFGMLCEEWGLVIAVLTVLELVFLLLGRMPLFEAMLTAFGTAGTGGFGFRNDSFASFSPYIQWVVTIFMILFGVNFNAYFLLLMRKFRRAAASEEVRGYFVVIAVAVGIITANIYSMYNSFGEALRQAAFQVGSIITTTGFSSCDFDLWPTLSKEILVMLMFIGACAGSTGGGIKVSRFLILGKTLAKELKTALHPQVVAPARMDGKLLNHETIRTTNVFVAAYIFIFAASFFLISLNGFDMVTNFTAVAATLNNIGPGLEMAGPMQNFGCFADPAKLVLIFDMLAGRLEIFPMLVLFMPDTWRRF